MTGAIPSTADGPNRSWHLGAGLEGRGVIVTGAATAKYSATSRALWESVSSDMSRRRRKSNNTRW